MADAFLLKEDGEQLLKEDGEALLLDVGIPVVVVFPPTPATLSSVLRGSHTPVSKVEFLAADYDTVELALDGRLVNGSVTTDRTSDTYSSASVEFVNDDGSLTPDVATHIWPNRPVRISRGALVDGAAVLVPLMTGVVADIQHSFDTGAVSFQVASRFSLAKRRFTGPTTIPAGIRGRDAIRILLELGGLGTSDALYALDDAGYTVLVPRTFDTNAEILGSAVKWAFDMGCNLWPDGAGVARMRPFTDALPVSWEFEEAALLTGLRRQIRSRSQVNRQTVYGRDVDGYGFSVQAVNTNPADPLYWTPELDLPAEPYTSPDITSTTVAQEVAEQLLREATGYEEVIPAEAVPVPLVAAGDVVGFATFGDTFLLDQASQPIYKGPMRMQTRRVRPAA